MRAARAHSHNTYNRSTFRPAKSYIQTLKKKSLTQTRIKMATSLTYGLNRGMIGLQKWSKMSGMASFQARTQTSAVGLLDLAKIPSAR